MPVSSGQHAHAVRSIVFFLISLSPILFAGDWIKLPIPSGLVTNSNLGKSVAINDDKIAAVSNFAVHIYRNTGSPTSPAWQVEQSIDPPGNRNLTQIDIHRTVAGISDGNRVYLYRFDGSTWRRERTIDNAASVAIDGDQMVTGRLNKVASGDNIRITFWQYIGDAWSESRTFTVELYTTTNGSEPSLDLDNGVAVAGMGRASGSDPMPGVDPSEDGVVYLFELQAGIWQELPQRLTGRGGFFGDQVALYDNIIAIQSPNVDFGDHTSVSIFERSGSTWSEVNTSAHASPGASEYDFGDVAVGENSRGERYVLSSHRLAAIGPRGNVGSVNLFQLIGIRRPTWQFLAEEQPVEAVSSGFGTSCDMDSGIMVVGALFDGDGIDTDNVGAVYTRSVNLPRPPSPAFDFAGIYFKWLFPRIEPPIPFPGPAPCLTCPFDNLHPWQRNLLTGFALTEMAVSIDDPQTRKGLEDLAFDLMRRSMQQVGNDSQIGDSLIQEKPLNTQK